MIADRSGLEMVTESMRPLHTGDFGGLWVKLIWFFFGLILSMMVLSGLLIWTKRTALATANALKRSEKPRRPAAVTAHDSQPEEEPDQLDPQPAKVAGVQRAHGRSEERRCRERV